MKDKTQPNEVAPERGNASGNIIPQYNAIDQKPDGLWVRKKRHFGGLMCPPMGLVPDTSGNTEGGKTKSR